jgi:GxxExxY protein
LRTAASRRLSESATKRISPASLPEEFPEIRPGAALAFVARMLAQAPFNAITHEIIGAAIEVHRILGPGLLESTYMPCLCFELTARKLRFVTEQRVPILYKTMSFEASYRIDLVIENLVVVEVKSLASVLPVHQAQVLTYMALVDCPAGLLINFNVAKLIDGVTRLIRPPRRDR